MARQQLYHPETLSIETSKIALLLGDRWSMLILSQLATEQRRFSTLQHNLGISSKILSNRLKELERQALITRTLYAQVPLRVEYELTQKGSELKRLLDAIIAWEKKWQ